MISTQCMLRKQPLLETPVPNRLLQEELACPPRSKNYVLELAGYFLPGLCFSRSVERTGEPNSQCCAWCFCRVLRHLLVSSVTLLELKRMETSSNYCRQVFVQRRQGRGPESKDAHFTEEKWLRKSEPEYRRRSLKVWSLF